MIDGRGRWVRTSETKRKMSVLAKASMTRRWKTQRPIMLAMIRKMSQDPKRRRRLSETHKTNGQWPGQPSCGARKLKRLLGRRWKLEYKVGGFGWPISVDIAYPPMRLAIEVDGVTHNDPKQQAKDRMRDQRLRSLGWSVFRISEEGCRLL
jgi:very-short-patch-repair endonuclease